MLQRVVVVFSSGNENEMYCSCARVYRDEGVVISILKSRYYVPIVHVLDRAPVGEVGFVSVNLFCLSSLSSLSSWNNSKHSLIGHVPALEEAVEQVLVGSSVLRAFLL